MTWTYNIMAYIIRIGDRHYIKRTSDFGAFHGSVVITDDIEDARRFTRKADANRRQNCLIWRINTYETDAHKLDVRGLLDADIVVTDIGW